MRNDDDFSDVTLACDGDQSIEAHKFILAAPSTFFSLQLKKNKHPHPLLYMRGVSSNQLKAVVDFIYYGEVNIYKDDLDEFLNIAEELQLRGISGSEAKKSQPQLGQYASANQDVTTFYEKVTFEEPGYVSNPIKADTSFEDTSMVPADVYSNKQITKNQNLEDTLISMMEILGPGKGYACKICENTEFKKKDHMRNHIEANHIEGVTHPCTKCGKSYRSTHCLTQHVSKYHRM